MEAASTRHAEASVLVESPLVYGRSKQIAERGQTTPLICLFPDFTKLGGCTAYDAEQGLPDSARRKAE
jgi:hypothetical protein